MDERELLSSIDAVAHGFEIVQSVYPGWRFKAADTVAAFALHGRYRRGPFVPLAEAARRDWFERLAGFEIALFRDGVEIDRGVAGNVLGGGPLTALRHFVARPCRHIPPVRASRRRHRDDRDGDARLSGRAGRALDDGARRLAACRDGCRAELERRSRHRRTSRLAALGVAGQLAEQPRHLVLERIGVLAPAGIEADDRRFLAPLAGGGRFAPRLRFRRRWRAAPRRVSRPLVRFSGRAFWARLSALPARASSSSNSKSSRRDRRLRPWLADCTSRASASSSRSARSPSVVEESTWPCRRAVWRRGSGQVRRAIFGSNFSARHDLVLNRIGIRPGDLRGGQSGRLFGGAAVAAADPSGAERSLGRAGSEPRAVCWFG